jgi:hypothetical protein
MTTTSPDPARRLPPTVLATCVLPWDDRLRFDEDAFREHVCLVAAHMTRHLYVFGTAGEGYTVTEAQFRDVARVFWDEARRCAGRGLGYRQFQISFPAWGRVSDAERDVFFAETCGRFGQAQFLHYNTPRGGRVLTGAEYGRLAAEHASLAAVKFTSSDAAVVAELARNAAPVQCFLTEPAYVLADGNYGLPVSLSGVRLGLPGRFQAARGAGLRELGRLAEAVDELLEDSFSAACPSAHMDGAYEKVLARAHGARLALRLLPPYQGAGTGYSPPPGPRGHRTRRRSGTYGTAPRSASARRAPPRRSGTSSVIRGWRSAWTTRSPASTSPCTARRSSWRAEATARWERINADGSRVVIVLRPVSVTGREQVR